VVESPANTLLIARDEQGAIVGTLTLIIFLVPGGSHRHVIDAGVWRDIDGWLDTALAPRAP